MAIIKHILLAIPRYLFTGFATLVSVFFLIALWQLGHAHYGDLVLPDPLATFGMLIKMLGNSHIQHQLMLTLQRALMGFAIAAILGLVLGMLAGSISTLALLLRPLATIFMGTPPIAWIVLTMIWFGMGNVSVVFTLVLAILPITFVGAMQGMRTLHTQFSELADGFAVPWMMRLSDIIFPHLFSYIFPSLVTALGMSWKIVVMAELLAASDGIGAQLAVANTQLDMQMALGLVVLVVGLLMGFEYLLMEPIKREVEKWRENT